MKRPGPVAIRAAILRLWAHAWPTPATPQQIERAARRWAAQDRRRGCRVVPHEHAPTVAPWGNA